MRSNCSITSRPISPRVSPPRSMPSMYSTAREKRGEPLCRSEQSVNAGKGAVCAELPADDHAADEVALPKAFRAEVFDDKPASVMTGDEHAGLGKTALCEDLFDVRRRFGICEIQIHNPLSTVMVASL